MAEFNLGNLFAQPGPPQGQTQAEPGMNWDFIKNMLQAGAHGVSAQRDPNYLFKLQAQKMEEDRQKEIAQVAKRQQGLAEVKTLGEIMDMAPAYRPIAIKSLARSMNLKEDDPDIKELSALMKAADEEDSAAIRDLIYQQGVDDPNASMESVLKQIRDPKARISILSEMGKARQKRSLEQALSQPDQPVQQTAVTPSLMGGEPRTQIAGGGAAPAPAIEERLKALQTDYDALKKQESKIRGLQAAPELKQPYMAQLNTQMDNIRGEMTQLLTLKNQGRMETRDVAVEQRFQQGEARREAQFAQGQAMQEQRHRESLQNQGRALIEARRESEQNAPLDIKATRWVNPQTLETASPDMTPKEAKDAGYSVITPSLSAAIPSAKVALKALDRYEALSKKLLVDTSKMSSVEAAAAVQANRVLIKAKRLKGDPEVAEFDSLQSTLPSQVKAFGDTGNIAIKEQEFAGKALPNETDSQASAARKSSSRRNLLKDVLKTNLSAASRKAQIQENAPAGSTGGWSIRPK